MTDITISLGSGECFAAYLATPSSTPVPGIVLIQEIFGVNAYMRTIADEICALGYVVLCPDLFWRQEPGIQLTDQTDEEWARAFELYQGFDVETGVGDLGATLAHLRGLDQCNGKAASVGYCLGGTLSYLMGCLTDVDCAVGYYGVGIDEALDKASGLSKPLMLHIAEDDNFVPAEAQQKIKDGLAGNDLVTIHSYPGVDHAFARAGGQSYVADAAELANRRSAEFLKANLG